jgi:hypothetical protein
VRVGYSEFNDRGYLFGDSGLIQNFPRFGGVFSASRGDRPALSISPGSARSEHRRQIFVLASKIRQQSSQPFDWLSLSHVPKTGSGIAVVICFDVCRPCGGGIDNPPSFALAGHVALAFPPRGTATLMMDHDNVTACRICGGNGGRAAERPPC